MAGWWVEKRFRSSGQHVGDPYWVFHGPDGTKYYSKKRAVDNGMSESISFDAPPEQQGPPGPPPPPAPLADAPAPEPEQQQDETDEKPKLAEHEHAVQMSESDGEIVEPKHVVKPMKKSPSKVCASPSGQESPPKTPPPKKRTLKDMVCEKDSTEKKRARTWAQKCGDNEKRSQCQLCKAPRSEDQRGGVCNSCLKAFRKLTGHQNMSKCKDDKDLMQKVLTCSKTLRGEMPKQPQKKQRHWKARLHDIEVMLGLLMNHFGLVFPDKQ